jgi:hypothetical protein
VLQGRILIDDLAINRLGHHTRYFAMVRCFHNAGESDEFIDVDLPEQKFWRLPFELRVRHDLALRYGVYTLFGEPAHNGAGCPADKIKWPPPPPQRRFWESAGGLKPTRLRSASPRHILIVTHLVLSMIKHMKGQLSAKVFAILVLVIWQAIPDSGFSIQPAFAAEAVAAAPDLTGVVKGTDGQVIKNAAIFIYTAGPRVGTGYL